MDKNVQRRLLRKRSREVAQQQREDKAAKEICLIKEIVTGPLEGFLAVNLILQEVKPVGVLYRKQLAQVGKISSNFMFQNE